ncbi:hypothetical protein GCM10009798_14170 [Nocardioides panacihumi]|uniref:N-acetyltransferase domain-containing protein n=1 Tax=Nocardioides panacihumi TaxID=400774 RepID=A0ABN2QSG3_9ACTN
MNGFYPEAEADLGELAADDSEAISLLRLHGLARTADDLAAGLREGEWLTGARVDGRLVGLIWARLTLCSDPNGPVVLIQQVLVKKSARRHGIGRRLVNSVLDGGRSRGARLATLRMHPQSQRAQHLAFYGSIGFVAGPEDDVLDIAL